MRLATILLTAFLAFGVLPERALASGPGYSGRLSLISTLESLQTACDQDANDDFRQALGELAKGMVAGVWSEPAVDALTFTDGDKLFSGDEAAANDLDRIVGDGLGCAGAALQAAQDITDLDQALAEGLRAIAAAGCTLDNCVSNLANGDAKMQESLDAEAVGDWALAIKRAREAWALFGKAAIEKSKSTICHIPPGNPDNRRTITISIRSLDTHMNQHGDHFGSCAFEGTGLADVGLASETNDPIAPTGTSVRSKVRIVNDGPDDATNIEVQVIMPGDTYASGETSGDSEMDLASGRWSIPYVEGNSIIELQLDGVATDELPEIDAYIVSSDQVDSNPDNDASAGYETPEAAPTSGYDGGLESNGDLAMQIAARHFRRAENVRTGKAAPTLRRFERASKLTGLDRFVPTAQRAQPFLSTPSDLVAVTNATGALAVDWITDGGSRIGAMLALQTAPGQVYDHTKVICDRLVGASLEGLRTIEVADITFVLTALRHEGGGTDYAVSFAVYEDGGGFAIESRFRNAEYTPPSTGSEVTNIQIWAYSPSVTLDLVSNLVSQLSATGSVRQYGSPPEVPEVTMRSAAYEGDMLALEINNPFAHASVTLSGVVRTTETATGEPFTRTIMLTPGLAKVVVPTGPLYDLGFTASTDAAASDDEVYVADGAWGGVADAGGGSVQNLEVIAQAPGSNSANVDRSIRLEGSVRTWIAAFRMLRAGGRPVDHANARRLVLEGRSSHPVRMAMTFQNGSDLASVETTVRFTDGLASVDLADLNGPDGWLSSVTQLTFFLDGNGILEEPALLEIDAVSFSIASSVGTEPQDLPDAEGSLRLAAPYPNPFSSSASISITTVRSGDVGGGVFDLLGRKVIQIPARRLPAGTHRMEIDGSRLPAGTYLVRITASSVSETRTLVRAR